MILPFIIIIACWTLASSETVCSSVDDCLQKADKTPSKELKEQSTYLEAALNFGPTNDQRATIYFRLGKIWSALGFLNKAIESVCDTSHSFSSFSPLGKTSDTLQFKTSHSVVKSPDTLYHMGLAHMKRQSWKEAAESFRPVCRL